MNDHPAFRPFLGFNKEEGDLHKRLWYLLNVLQRPRKTIETHKWIASMLSVWSWEALEASLQRKAN